MDKKSSKKCPMCNTVNDGPAKTCSYCGFIFEDQHLTLEAQTSEITEAAPSSDHANKPPDQTNGTKLSTDTQEVILEEQHDVICKSSLIILEGTLVLTNKRLLFVVGDEAEEFQTGKEFSQNNTVAENPQNLPDDTDNLAIPLESVVSVTGKKGMLRPSLRVSWHDDLQNQSKTTEFVQKVRSTSSDRKIINEWASLIENMKSATIDVKQTSFSSRNTDPDSLEHKILDVLGNMEWKGLFQIKGELKERFQTDFDIDEIETVANKLVHEKIVEQDKIGEFYRKRTPIKAKELSG